MSDASVDVPAAVAGTMPEDLSTLAVPVGSPAAARSRVYALLAQLLRFPQNELGERLASGALYAEMADATGTLPFRMTFLPPPLLSLSQLRQTYTALFEAIGGKPQVSLLEQRYEGAPSEQELWQELLRFYRYFGLDFSTGNARERPDHLLVELEFMHYLSFLEAGARSDTATGLLRAQQDFLERHLARWLPALREALTGTRESPAPYGEIGDLLVRFVGADCAWLGTPHAGPVPG